MPSQIQEQPVRWNIKVSNANTKLDEVQRIVDEAVGGVRAERRAKSLRRTSVCCHA